MACAEPVNVVPAAGSAVLKTLTDFATREDIMNIQRLSVRATVMTALAFAAVLTPLMPSTPVAAQTIRR